MSSNNKKPFPWKCSNCREKAVREAVVNYCADLEHDGRKFTVRIEGLKTPQCEKCGMVHPDAEANEEITLALLIQAKLLTPEQIRHHREGLHLTQSQLATALGVAEDTVDRWENGVQIQPRSLDNLLRLYFRLPQAREILAAQQIGASPSVAEIALP